MLAIEGLEKAYAGRRVLAGADLIVGEGEAVALLGSNGSGKTTTLRCIVGLARPDAGSIRIDGIDALAQPRRALELVSYLPQRPCFPATLTVREVVGVTARLRGRAPAAIDREIERCGLTHVAERFVSQLSGGERQRVGLAVTFVADVPLYVFDEPSASLDRLAAGILVDRARTLRRKGRAVLYSTHVAADIDSLATRVAILQRGRMQVLDDPELRGELVTGRPASTPGERALERLEVEDGEPLDAGCERPVAAVGGVRAWVARAAVGAAGQR